MFAQWERCGQAKIALKVPTEVEMVWPPLPPVSLGNNNLSSKNVSLQTDGPMGSTSPNCDCGVIIPCQIAVSHACFGGVGSNSNAHGCTKIVIGRVYKGPHCCRMLSLYQLHFIAPAGPQAVLCKAVWKGVGWKAGLLPLLKYMTVQFADETTAAVPCVSLASLMMPFCKASFRQHAM